ncbi:unnamed protein product [Effrenium voratum]|uniref:Uncharacterized protein n=1 Tax=Effrenium voratum TaxID=2562239 RepID=A0AA36NHW0_9DINO|nr:unnamed protein product [Effrenium voratum]
MDEFMDATVQISAYGLTAGCTLCLDNVPNQLAVLGHFRAMLEMCQNQIEGDPEQEDSWHEVDTQLRLVKLMIKVAQGRRKATKVEVLPCILSTSFKHGSEVSSDVASPVSRSQNRGRRLPKIEPDGPVQEETKTPSSGPSAPRTTIRLSTPRKTLLLLAPDEQTARPPMSSTPRRSRSCPGQRPRRSMRAAR